MGVQRYIFLMGCTALGFINRLSPVAAQPPTVGAIVSQSTSAFPTDTRLDRRFDLDYTGIELGDLAAKLSDSTLTLRAADECTHQKLQMHMHNRSLREVMEGVSSLLQGYWIATPSGYMARMKAGEVLKRKEWWGLFTRQRDAAFAARRSVVLKAMQTPPLAPDHAHPNAELLPADEATSYRLAMDIASVYNGLPADVQDRIANSTCDFAQYTNYFGGCVEEGGVAVPLASLPANIQYKVAVNAEKALAESKTSAGQTNALFLNLGSMVCLSLLTPDGTSIRTRYTLDAFSRSADATVFGIEQGALPEMVHRLGKDAPSLWQRMAEFQSGRVWPNDRPEAASRNWPPLRLTDCLRRLREKADIEYLADYYSGPGRAMTDTDWSAPLAPIKAELDEIADYTDTSWRAQGDNIYLIRNNRWYRDDYIEPPASAVAIIESEAAVHRVENRTPDAHSAAASPADIASQALSDSTTIGALTPWQIARGLAWTASDASTDSVPATAGRPSKTAYPFARLADRLMRERKTLQFYSKLPALLQQRLIEGSLRISELAPDLQVDALIIAPELQCVDVRNVAIGLRPMKEPALLYTMVPQQGPQDPRPALHLEITHPGP